MYQIIRYSSIDSTNTRLKQQAMEGAPSGTVLVADRQTAGRGRLGRQFFSPEGSGLYMSLLIRPVRLCDAGLLTTLAAVAVARALEGFGVPTGIKWVNDLMVDGRKLCGILAEAGIYEGQPFAVIGIGINLKKAAFPGELTHIAISMEEVLGTSPSRDEVMHAVLDQLARVDLSGPKDPAALMEEYRRRSVTLGRAVRVIPHSGESYEAVAVAIREDGSLDVRVGAELRNVSSGEVSIKI